jgi:SAM-dependent methyltransferase
MASSFAEQIPLILYLIQKCGPKSVLDIGKGFGKYGFLTHEYAGIDHTHRPDPSSTLAAQSRIAVDAVDCNTDYLWPHIEQIYRKTYVGRIEELYPALPQYDLVLMCDVIEHIEKAPALAVVQHFLNAGSKVLISTPKEFFQQDLYGSAAEHHVSYWTKADFRADGNYVDYQTVGPGRVFLLARQPINIRGFGQGVLKSCRRLARALVNEIAR